MKQSLFFISQKISRALNKHAAQIPGASLFIRGFCAVVYSTLKPNGVSLTIVQGKKMYVDTRDQSLAKHLLMKEVWEEYETKIFKEIIKPGMVVVDAGANIGYYTLIAAERVGEKGRVYAFEPEPSNYFLLLKNIKINGYKNVVTIKKALSNKHGKIKLFKDKFNLGAHSMSEKNVYKGDDSIRVETVALDSIIVNHKVDVIKMDVQGAEGLILQGSKNILKKNPKTKIIMEIWPYGLKNVGMNALDVLRELQQYGFKIKHIDEKNRSFNTVELVEFVKLCEKQKKEYTNILLEK